MSTHSATGGLYGFQNIAGEAGGYIWITFRDAGGNLRVCRMDKIRCKLGSGYSIERGVTNSLDVNASSLEAATGTWASYYRKNAALTVRTLASELGITAKNGDYVYRIKGSAEPSADTSILTELKPNPIVQPTVNQYITMSFWVKALSGHNRLFGIQVYLLGIGSGGDGTVATTNWSYSAATNGWRKITVWGKCTQTFTGTNGVKLAFYTRPRGAYPSGGNYTLSDAEWGNCDFVVDAASIYVSDSIHYSGDWQIGGTARTDEYAAVPMADIGSNWSVAFSWYPKHGATEIHDDIPIATIKGVDGSSIYLFYDQSEGKFVLLDNGTDTASSAVVTWEPIDIIRFAITSDGTDSTLWIQTTKDALDDTADSFVPINQSSTECVWSWDIYSDKNMG